MHLLRSGHRHLHETKHDSASEQNSIRAELRPPPFPSAPSNHLLPADRPTQLRHSASDGRTHRTEPVRITGAAGNCSPRRQSPRARDLARRARTPLKKVTETPRWPHAELLLPQLGGGAPRGIGWLEIGTGSWGLTGGWRPAAEQEEEEAAAALHSLAHCAGASVGVCARAPVRERERGM